VAEGLQHLDRFASALTAAGLPDGRRDEALARLVEVGLTEADLGDLRARKAAMEDEIQTLEADRAEYQRSLAALQEAVADACRKESEVSRRVAALQKLLRQLGLIS
jgi:chromosome segregation ATPase